MLRKRKEPRGEEHRRDADARSAGVGGGEALMKNTKKCPKCQSSDIALIPEARSCGIIGRTSDD
jgi:hypothetical protein